MSISKGLEKKSDGMCTQMSEYYAAVKKKKQCILYLRQAVLKRQSQNVRSLAGRSSSVFHHMGLTIGCS